MAAATGTKKPRTRKKPEDRMPKQVVSVLVELPSINYATRSYSRSDRQQGGNFTLKRDGERVEVKAPCGERVAEFGLGAFTKAAEMLGQEVEVKPKT